VAKKIIVRVVKRRGITLAKVARPSVYNSRRWRDKKPKPDGGSAIIVVTGGRTKKLVVGRAVAEPGYIHPIVDPDD